MCVPVHTRVKSIRVGEESCELVAVQREERSGEGNLVRLWGTQLESPGGSQGSGWQRLYLTFSVTLSLSPGALQAPHISHAHTRSMNE